MSSNIAFVNLTKYRDDNGLERPQIALEDMLQGLARSKGAEFITPWSPIDHGGVGKLSPLHKYGENVGYGFLDYYTTFLRKVPRYWFIIQHCYIKYKDIKHILTFHFSSFLYTLLVKKTKIAQ